MPEKSIADVGAAEAALAKATAGLAAGAGQLAPQEPQYLDQIPDFVNAADGSKVQDADRFRSLLTDWRTAADILGNILRDSKKAGRVAADAIAALRCTVILANGKPDYFGDSLVWKSYVAPMLKRELESPEVFGITLGREVWNNAVNYYHGRDLTIDAAIVADAIADGRINPDDAEVYHAVLTAHEGNLGKVKRDGKVGDLPDSVVELVNSEITASAQARPNWKLEKVVRQTREEKMAADPSKAIKDAKDALTAIARIRKPGESTIATLTPLASVETYYEAESILVRDMLVQPDGKPRKGGIKELPKVLAALEMHRDMLDNAIRYLDSKVPDDAKPDMDTVLATLYTGEAVKK
jgi:hypothetical protein